MKNLSSIHLERLMEHISGSISQTDGFFWDLWLDHFRWPLLSVADELGFFKLLSQRQSFTIEDLEFGLKLSHQSLVTLLAFTCSEGLVEKVDGYRLTEKARTFLLPQSRYYWGGMFLGWRKYDLYQEMKAAILGRSEYKHTDRWKFDLSAPVMTSHFLAAMNSHCICAAEYVAKSGVFVKSSKMLDVGGGSGCFSVEACRSNPNLSSIIIELPRAFPHFG